MSGKAKVTLYAERDIMDLATYSGHVLHMTSEDLRSKSDIAAELAFRDEQITQLREENERLKKDKILAPDGWQLVPIKPTGRMRHAYHRAVERYEDGFGEMPDSGWVFMLNASPEPMGIVPTPHAELEQVTKERDELISTAMVHGATLEMRQLIDAIKAAKEQK